VTKVHLEALRYAKEGYSIVLVGHRQHVEVVGTLGEAPDAIVVCESVAEVEQLQLPNPEKVAYITQTTLSLDDCAAIVGALKKRYPSVREPAKDDICYATQNRQNAVKVMAPKCPTVLVVGAPASSNANRLVEVAAALGSKAYLIESADDIQPEWLTGDVGLTAGAFHAGGRRAGVRRARVRAGGLPRGSVPAHRGAHHVPAPGRAAGRRTIARRVGGRGQRARGRACRGGVPHHAPLTRSPRPVPARRRARGRRS
jgi:hypothetical protein